mmetsp:Transcript_13954/g.27890  ORF Transcript_13954/g.27890 Transcript_13954/m.27890 type:complete len:258 (+) Transcript_13954:1577-2350(+)
MSLDLRVSREGQNDVLGFEVAFHFGQFQIAFRQPSPPPQVSQRGCEGIRRTGSFSPVKPTLFEFRFQRLEVLLCRRESLFLLGLPLGHQSPQGLMQNETHHRDTSAERSISPAFPEAQPHVPRRHKQVVSVRHQPWVSSTAICRVPVPVKVVHHLFPLRLAGAVPGTPGEPGSTPLLEHFPCLHLDAESPHCLPPVPQFLLESVIVCLYEVSEDPGHISLQVHHKRHRQPELLPLPLPSHTLLFKTYPALPTCVSVG